MLPLGVRRLVGAFGPLRLVAARLGSSRVEITVYPGPDRGAKAAAGQSADKAAHSKESPLRVTFGLSARLD